MISKKPFSPSIQSGTLNVLQVTHRWKADFGTLLILLESRNLLQNLILSYQGDIWHPGWPLHPSPRSETAMSSKSPPLDDKSWNSTYNLKIIHKDSVLNQLWPYPSCLQSGTIKLPQAPNTGRGSLLTIILNFTLFHSVLFCFILFYSFLF